MIDRIINSVFGHGRIVAFLLVAPIVLGLGSGSLLLLFDPEATTWLGFSTWSFMLAQGFFSLLSTVAFALLEGSNEREE